MNPFLSLAIAIAIGVGGQITLKHGALCSAEQQREGLNFFLCTPIICGYGAYFLSAMFYTFSLKSLPVSAAFSGVSLSYFFVAMIAHFLWGEPFGWQQVLALGLISAGVIMMFHHAT